MRSLRGRLLLGTAIGSTAVLLAAGVILYLLVRMSLTAEFDTALAAKAHALAALVEQDGENVDFEAKNLNMPEFSRSVRPEYFELWLADDRVLARSPSLGSRDLARIAGPLAEPVFRKARLPDGRPGRFIGIAFAPRQEDNEGDLGEDDSPNNVTLVLGRETASIDVTLARLKLLLGSVWVAAILSTLGVLAVVVRRGLRPAERLATQISRVGEDDLATRIELANAPAELMPVVQRLNDLFARLEAAFTREKAFSADIAHELRTPLAGLRATLEISLTNPREPAVYREAMTDCLGITRQMQAMVENLLALTRAEAGQIKIERRPVDLAGVFDECWKTMAARADARGLNVEWRIARPCTLESDADKLRQVLYNLLDNAVTYADEHGRISIEAESRDGRTSIRIANTGSRLAPEQVRHVFDRFWRGDTARTDVGLRCGLGLSLAQKMVILLGGTIAADSAAGGEFVVTVELPEAICSSGSSPLPEASALRSRSTGSC